MIMYKIIIVMYIKYNEIIFNNLHVITNILQYIILRL
jgi:hypothetical protein